MQTRPDSGNNIVPQNNLDLVRDILRTLNNANDEVFENCMPILATLPSHQVADRWQIIMPHIEYLKYLKNRIYYYIKKQPLETRINLCEQALDENTHIGAIMHVQRGSRKCDKTHGTLWWIDKYIYQPALKEQDKLPPSVESAPASPLEKDKEEADPAMVSIEAAQVTEEMNSATTRIYPVTEQTVHESFETVSAIIEGYRELLKCFNNQELHKLGIENLHELKNPQTIADVLESLPQVAYALADKCIDESIENRFLQLLNDIATSSSQNASALANILAERKQNTLMKILDKKSDTNNSIISLLDNLSASVTPEIMLSILSNTVPREQQIHPDTFLLTIAIRHSKQHVESMINMLKIISSQGIQHAQAVYDALQHKVNIDTNNLAQWNFGNTVARHQDAATYLQFIQLLECLQKQGISQDNIKSLLPIDYERFGDRSRKKSTKEDILAFIKNLPVNQRIAMCDQALNKDHPLGHILYLQRGINMPMRKHGTLEKIANVREAALKIQEHANDPIIISRGSTVNLLWVASRDGNIEEVKRQIENGANIEICDKNGESPLHAAVCNNHLEIVKILVDAGADIEKQSINLGTTALHLAAMHGNTSTVKFLLERGACADVTTFSNNATALFMAAQAGKADCIRALIKHGADPLLPFITTKDDFIAFFGQRLNIPNIEQHAQIILERADKNNELFITPAEIAHVMGHEEIAEIINEYARVTSSQQTVLASDDGVPQPVIPTKHEVQVEGSPETTTTHDIMHHPYLQLAEQKPAVNSSTTRPLEEPLLDDIHDIHAPIEIVIDNPPPSYEEAISDNACTLIPGLPYPRFFAASSHTPFSSEQPVAQLPVTGDLLLSYDPIQPPDLITFPEAEDLIAFHTNNESETAAENQLRILDELKVPTGKASSMGQFAAPTKVKDNHTIEKKRTLVLE